MNNSIQCVINTIRIGCHQNINMNVRVHNQDHIHILNVKCVCHPRFERVALVKILDRIILKILLLTHMAVNTTSSEYLCDLIRLNVKSTTIRTRASFDPCFLCFPPISKTCAKFIL